MEICTKVLHGCSLDILKTLETNSIDSVVTDPPYGLAFMNKHWDYDVPSIELWHEVMRVLKPGGHLLSFGGTRTYHRMVVNIEDAGFEIRDQIQWLYGSGFPKSHNISKAIDKKMGAEREVIGPKKDSDGRIRATENKADEIYICTGRTMQKSVTKPSGNLETAPATDLAKQWDGFGTALKPANEPIVMARKPLSEKTIVDNVLKWGTGGINIDGCRVETSDSLNGGTYSKNSEYIKNPNEIFGARKKVHSDFIQPQGRFPANIILDEDAAQMLDEQSGVSKSTGGGMKRQKKDTKTFGKYGLAPQVKNCGLGDKGGASRFFYVAKASKRERNAGLEGMETKRKSHMQTANGSGERSMKEGFPDTYQQNHHPTVKPVKLMQYLVRLVTPPGGTVLDPFMGSGTTGCAAKREGFGFVGIEREAEYCAIAEKRIDVIQYLSHG